jgi:hypothetical protein
MKKSLIILLFMLFQFPSHAQLISNKLDLFLSCHTNNISGNEMVSGGGFISPALFPNMDKSLGYSIRGILELTRFFDLGAGLNLNTFSDWNLSDYDYYSTAKVKTGAFGITAALHTPVMETGVLNRFKLSMYITPELGIAKFKADTLPIGIIPETNSELSEKYTSHDWMIGIDVSMGLEFRLSNDIGLFARYGYQKNKISPKLYPDDNLSFSYFEGGVFIRLWKNKRYYL